MRTHFKTAKGTELPLRNMRGSEYLDVKWRIVWFREECPEASIKTEIISVDKDHAIFKATITEVPSGTVMATSHKSETKSDFKDFIEKAETGAIGRALALCGFGTQFAEDLDEGDRLADSPVDRPTKEYSTISTGDGIVIAGYRIPGHIEPAKIRGKIIEECETIDLEDSVTFYQDKYKGKYMPEKASEYVQEAIRTLKEREL